MFDVLPLRDLTGFDIERFKREEIAAYPSLCGPDGELFGHEWSRWVYDSFDAAVDDWLAGRPHPAAILDVGCASGVTAARFAAAGHRVTALDIMPPREGAFPAGVAFMQGDLRALTVEQVPGPFDLIHASRVLNFVALDDIDRFFGFASAALSPDGALALRLFVTDAEPDRIGARTRPGSRPTLPLAPGLVAHHFAELHALLDAHGFAIATAFSDARVEVGAIAVRHVLRDSRSAPADAPDAEGRDLE